MKKTYFFLVFILIAVPVFSAPNYAEYSSVSAFNYCTATWERVNPRLFTYGTKDALACYIPQTDAALKFYNYQMWRSGLTPAEACANVNHEMTIIYQMNDRN